tara:strand:+ start:7604 stop:7732 length:129 start_codon:yes stop_codon:yes gene_type:complete
MTGEKHITDINIVTVFNYLEIEKDFNEEIRKAEKRAQLHSRR